MKPCPYCAEDIRDDAVKCRFCGEFLDQSLSGVPAQFEATPEEQRKWAEIRRLQRIASGPPSHYMWQKKHEEATRGQVAASNITFEELNAHCGPASPLPTSVRQNIFDKHHGSTLPKPTNRSLLTYNPGR